VGAEARKWGATLRTWWARHLAYKLNFVLLIIGPSVVFFFIKLNLWRSIYLGAAGAGSAADVVIQGYDLAAMLRYQAWVMITAFLAQGFNSMNLAEDIRMGRISSYLIYPFSFWKYHAASFLAFQGIQLVVAAVTLAALTALGVLTAYEPLAVLHGVLFASLVGALWFAVCFVLGLVAFWLEETWVLRVMFLTISSFASGAIVPLEIYPDWCARLLFMTPFPYMTFVPVRIFMSSYDGSILRAAAILVLWTVAAACVSAYLWRRGLKLYTAAGM
jgi:ABC-2 type transport system permease protein